MIAKIEKIEFVDEQEVLEVLQTVYRSLDYYQDRDICTKVYDILENIKLFLEYEYNIGIPQTDYMESPLCFDAKSDFEFNF